ncbi:TIGR01457 family HAD-type hydrolase [Atopobacter sp. AH10]|uniref:TIGR01457 family HAD-type hydrolase n=1 Tax=Atopobacter sp. AH10 TaxID=2315861 RepID=UPI000EF21540|nr:TIGR01457 family HAD-type hydrolase [Atopobacter sp. AH10]RLK62773.1 TIGR01457 family HAD-type hydrolase [Atopobacter sp. AH10]
MRTYKGYAIDLDGTVYFGKNRIKTAEKFVQELNERKIPYVFLTNNATRTPEEVVEHLKNYEIETTVNHVYTSGQATVDYLLEHYKGQTLMLVGSPALKKLLIEANIQLVEENPDIVLQSFSYDVDYRQLMEATLAIRQGAKFVVTNPDSNLPNERGLIPGSGATTAFLKTATGVEPEIIGKPYAPIMEGALQHMGLSADEVLMIGDNYNTDIRAGLENGVDTLMVLTGFSTRESIEGLEQPTYILNDLSEWDLDANED